jgi:colicin import membrane protein
MDRSTAELALKLQSDLSLRPTKAARLAKLMGENARPLLDVDSKTLASTVSATVHIKPEDLFSPVSASTKVKGSSTLTSTTPDRTLSSSATAAIAKAAETAARRTAAPNERTHNPLTGKTLLVDLPAKPLRRRSKDDIWTDLAKVDAAEAVKESAARKRAEAAEKARYQNELNAQLEAARKAQIEARKKELEYAETVVKASEDYNRQQAEIAARKAAHARELAEEAKRLMAEANATKEAERQRSWKRPHRGSPRTRLN